MGPQAQLPSEEMERGVEATRTVEMARDVAEVMGTGILGWPGERYCRCKSQAGHSGYRGLSAYWVLGIEDWDGDELPAGQEGACGSPRN